VAKERIYVVCGVLGGSNGGGGLYAVDANSPEKYTEILADGYQHGQAMCRISNERLYICCGRAFGAQGGGQIWEVDVPNAKSSEVCKGYENCATMTHVGSIMYLVCGKQSGCGGGGGLYRLDPRTGKYEEVGNDWQNATCMQRVNDKVYIICGKAYGCQGGGGLYQVDPRKPGSPVQIGVSEWENATHMTSIGTRLYIVCGPPKGGGGIWEVFPEDERKRVSEVTVGWYYTTCMVGLEDTKRLYMCNGVARGQNRSNPNPSSAGLYSLDPSNPRAGYQTLQSTGWVNATLMA